MLWSNVGKAADTIVYICGILFLLLVLIGGVVRQNPALVKFILPQPLTPILPPTMSYENIPLSRLTPEYIADQLAAFQHGADTIASNLALRSGDSIGLIWFGINPSAQNFIIFFDYYENCYCENGLFTLRRYSTNEMNVRYLVNYRKITPRQYFLLEGIDRFQDSDGAPKTEEPYGPWVSHD